MSRIFPFAALVGNELLRTALLACAVYPSIGGVLIRGDKGTAKSTAARALAAVLPPIPADFLPAGASPLVQAGSLRSTAVPFVNLPLGATEDRVIGSLDFEKALKDGKRAFQPGLLATAHRGILYIDEVNLLPDHLVDSLLDVAASGVNTIEREGITHSHPASFALIGSMNLEEGDLRPQLLDRFGLMADVVAPADPGIRCEIVRRRLEFEADPEGFLQRFEEQQRQIGDLVVKAQSLLPNVELSDSHQMFISEVCCQMQVRSLRADLVINKTARALAALAGRSEVMLTDIHQACALALPHRCRTKPGERSSLDKQRLDDMFNEKQNQPPEEEHGTDNGDLYSPDSDCPDPSKQRQSITDVSPVAQSDPVRRVVVQYAGRDANMGRRSNSSSTARGAYLAAVKPQPGQTGSVAADATIKHSILRNDGALNVTGEDIHIKQRAAKIGNTILFVVDASGSMSAMQRMSAVKGAAIALLDDAYQCRDQVGVISFRGQDATVLLAPTRSTDIASRQLEELMTGGTTPLAHALELALTVLTRAEDGGQVPLMVLLTDGKTNVALQDGGDAWLDAITTCDRLCDSGIASLVVDTETGYVLLGQARALAAALGAECIRLDELTGETLKLNVKSRLKRRTR